MPRRLRRVLCAAVLIFPAVPAAAQSPAARFATCDADALDATSYALTTRAQAHILTDDRTSWWDGFLIGKHAAALRDLNVSATSAAEHARQIDAHNLLAHGILARQYVTVGEDATLADQAWRTVLDNGGAITWTATLHDVDYKSYFVVAFDRHALRIYRYGELAGRFEKSMGMPTFVGADREGFYRALGGCIDAAARPEVVVPWTEVREIKAGNWVLYFKLARSVAIASDNGKRRTGDEIKVNLHGATGHVEIRTRRDSRGVASTSGIGIGPLDFQQRVRYTLVKHVDPAGLIRLPKASRSAGW